VSHIVATIRTSHLLVADIAGFPRLVESPRFLLKISRIWKGKSRKIRLVLYSPAKMYLKIVHFSSGLNGKQAAAIV